MPAAIRSRQRSGRQIGRRLDVHRGAEQDARDRDGPEMFVERRLGMLRHAGAGLGAEILDDDFLHVAVALVQLAQRQQRLDALAPRLADADQDAGGERHLRPRRRRAMVASRTAGSLSGEPKCGPPRRDSRSAAVSSIRPCDTETARSRTISSARHHAGIEMRQQPGLVEHQLRHGGEIRRACCRGPAVQALRARRDSAARACRRA